MAWPGVSIKHSTGVTQILHFLYHFVEPHVVFRNRGLAFAMMSRCHGGGKLREGVGGGLNRFWETLRLCGVAGLCMHHSVTVVW